MPAVERRWTAAYPVAMSVLLGVHRRGRADPTYVTDRHGGIWRASRTPDGPATARFVHQARQIVVSAWGPGAQWLCEHSPRWLGASDDPSGFAPAHPLLRDGARRLAGPRVGATGLVMEALVPAVLEQKVTGGQAREAWRWLLRRYGEPAPGPAAGMVVPPDPGTWRSIPSWDWHRAGVGPQRSATIVRAATVAARLEEIVGMDEPAADARLRSLPGVGAWTSAEVRQRALGHADAISLGDLHVPRLVVFALTGEVTDSDDDMLAVLEPYRGHRFRVQRICELSDVRAPRFGPRYAPHDFRAS